MSTDLEYILCVTAPVYEKLKEAVQADDEGRGSFVAPCSENWFDAAVPIVGSATIDKIRKCKADRISIVRVRVK